MCPREGCSHATALQARPPVIKTIKLKDLAFGAEDLKNISQLVTLVCCLCGLGVALAVFADWTTSRGRLGIVQALQVCCIV